MLIFGLPGVPVMEARGAALATTIARAAELALCLVVCMWLAAIPPALLGAFVLGWPVLLVYACTCLDEVGKIPWVMLRFRKYKWVQDLTR